MNSYLIFGATSGIGAAMAEDALERGCRVIALGRNASALEALAAKGATTRRIDLIDGEARKELWEGLNDPSNDTWKQNWLQIEFDEPRTVSGLQFPRCS